MQLTLKRFNIASMQDTAHIHTKQMGEFKTPLHFGRALPSIHSQHGVGVNEPPYVELQGHITLKYGENGLK